jgi:predicted DNA-binding WGR domain protein
MHVKLNVGLSKKVGDANYGSRGASVNVELELESALVGEPDKLKERIRQVFNSLRSSLAEELSGNGHHQVPANSTNGHHNGPQSVNGPAPAGGTTPTSVRPATASQIKAIRAIARSQQIDLSLFLKNRFQRQRPEELTIKEASDAIDDLKRKA